MINCKFLVKKLQRIAISKTIIIRIKGNKSLMRPIFKSIISILCFFILMNFSIFHQNAKPVIFIIGDSTVRNGDGSGSNGQWGWGSFMEPYFDTSKVMVKNLAIGGRSSRTFITEGRWQKVLDELQKGDYVIMQFGHNDAGPLDDTARASGTIAGIGFDSLAIYNPIRKMKEVVHTYGWYMRKYIIEAQNLGGIPIVCSPIPRNDWKEGKVLRSNDTYSGWSKKVAIEENAFFIDLNDLVALQYEQMGEEKVKAFFPAEHTHTDKNGAILNAAIVIHELRSMNPYGIKEVMKSIN